MENRNNSRKKFKVFYVVVAITGVIALFVGYIVERDSVEIFYMFLIIELLIYSVVSIIKRIFRRRR